MSRRTSNAGLRLTVARHLELVGLARLIPSAVYSQDSGLVDGRVGSDFSTSSTQPSPSNGLRGDIGVPPNLARALAPQVLSCPARLCPRICLSLQDRTGAARPLSPDAA
jgi:hypothetical protein